ncbi:uncharacterized protein LOC131042990 [Cryptomeria japonica]|uniref:uncharacterized protein LOC131042990 n=1 Tax=Cryptomeria japonica TaxID=3369 RepID=UPI0027DA879A|nr:uncharacterized protein LOC131042990 [Cryptomeria japonica]
MQQHILQDAFPNYEGGRKIQLRDSDDGKDKLREAFSSEGNKPVFLYIDNALHKKDLKQLLPEDLGCLPQHNRILITSRTKDIVDMLEERGFHDRIKDYPVETLSDNDAMQVLCKDHAIRDRIKDDLQNIVNVCKGIPLVLTVVGAKLRKQKYDVSRCSRIIEDLKEGKEIRDLSHRLFHFVYEELDEATQEAFLDICCCFNDKERRFVEYIVGAEEVTILEEAALITPVMVQSNPWSWEEEEEEEERLTVHDIIRSIGRTLAKSSRIVDANAWAEAEKDEARLKRVKTVCFSGDKNYILEERHFNSMKESLRILVWGGSINVSVPYAVTLPEIRWARISGGFSWLNVEALHKLASLWCRNLPTQQRKLPKSLRRLSIFTQPAATRDLLNIVPNSSLEDLNLSFPDEDPSQPFNEEEDNTTDIFNRFLRLQDLINFKVSSN